MSRDDEGSGLRTGFYWGLGVLAAAGAAYVVWKYVLTDDQKHRAMDLAQDGVTKAKRAVRDVRAKV